MNGLWTPQSAAITDPPMPQPAALWPSPRNVLRQRLTIFSSEYCCSFTYPGGMEGWVGLSTMSVNNLLKLLLESGPGGIKPATFESLVRYHTTTPPSHIQHIDMHEQYLLTAGWLLAKSYNVRQTLVSSASQSLRQRRRGVGTALVGDILHSGNA